MGKIHTFFQPVGNMNAFEQGRMIELWKRAWTRDGWDPVVLTPKEARGSPLYDNLLPKFQAMPTVNHKDYEMACWLRWIAMSSLGGFMVDYDVMPFGFRPDMLPKNEGAYVSVMADNNPCPCAVHGTAEQFENTARLMGDLVVTDEHQHGGRAHFSDQSAIQALSSILRPHIHDMCPEYNSRHWKVSALVHYCHGATHGRDRVGLMREALEGRRE